MDNFILSTLEYQGKPLFQHARISSSICLKNTLHDTACFIYVTEGEGQLIEVTGTFRIQKKEALVKSCGNFISNYIKEKSENDFEAFIVYFYKDILLKIYSEVNPIPDERQSNNSPRIINDNPLVRKFVNELPAYFNNTELIDDSLMVNKLKELILILLKSQYYENVVELFSDLFSKSRAKFREVVQNNLFSPINIEQMAFLANRSLSTFKREFKKEFNDTPARFIKKKRLEKAAYLLNNGDKSISDIAYTCGVQDLSTFSSVFRDFYLVSPTEFRLNQNRKTLN